VKGLYILFPDSIFSLDLQADMERSGDNLQLLMMSSRSLKIASGNLGCEPKVNLLDGKATDL
jgi:hypothetical protein